MSADKTWVPVRDLLKRAEGELTRNPRLSLDLSQQAWKGLKKSDHSEAAHCRLVLGLSHLNLSLAGEAAGHFREALDLSLAYDLPGVEVRARLGLGAVYRQIGRFDTAIDHLSRAWRKAQTEGDDLGQMQADLTLGQIDLALDRPEDALDRFFQARALAQKSQTKGELVDVLLSLGQTFQTLKRNDEALEQLSRALVLSKDTSNRIAEARALTLIGLLYRDSGELDISEEYHLECLKICKAIDHPWGQLEAYFNLGDLHALRGFRDVALRYFEKVGALAQTLDARSHQVRVDLRMAEIWESSGNLAKALEATRRALVTERALKSEEASRTVRTLLDQFREEQSRTQAELLRLRSERLEAESAELKKALDSLRVISELGRRITASLTVKGLFEQLYNSLSEVFDLAAFGLALYDPKDGSMRYPYRIDSGVHIAPRERRPAKGTLSGWVLEARKTLLIGDVETEVYQFLDRESADRTVKSATFRSAIFLPLLAGEDPIGVITVQHKAPRAFDEVHARFLETLGGYIVVALRNALSHRKVRRLNRQILKLAQYDPLTGLANRRLLSDYLKRTIAISHRRDRKFALFFLDLDGFKPVNDHWGHEAGDAVLSQIGQRLAQSLRDSDLVARVGGDEFVALVLEVEDPHILESVADKLLVAATSPVVWRDNEIVLGVSIGIAVYPTDATDPDGLLNKADAAMYRVKHAGKNSWSLASDLPDKGP